jgi:hypothetical protein
MMERSLKSLDSAFFVNILFYQPISRNMKINVLDGFTMKNYTLLKIFMQLKVKNNSNI